MFLPWPWVCCLSQGEPCIVGRVRCVRAPSASLGSNLPRVSREGVSTFRFPLLKSPEDNCCGKGQFVVARRGFLWGPAFCGLSEAPEKPWKFGRWDHKALHSVALACVVAAAFIFNILSVCSFLHKGH